MRKLRLEENFQSREEKEMDIFWMQRHYSFFHSDVLFSDAPISRHARATLPL